MIYELNGTRFNLQYVFSIGPTVRDGESCYKIPICSIGGAEIEIRFGILVEEFGDAKGRQKFMDRVNKEAEDLIKQWKIISQ